LKYRADLVEHSVATGSGAIRFADPLEHDHCGS
jgi:hypothetical protein